MTTDRKRVPAKRKPRSATAAKRARRASSHGTRVKATYGISRVEYEALFLAQGGMCAICLGRRSYHLAVDHCHTTGEIRGLLCKQCNNRLLPTVKDSVELLQAAIDYLTNPPARRHFGDVRSVPTHENDEVLRAKLWKAEKRARPKALDPAYAEELTLWQE